ncbi:hypothetical protein ENSA5_54130 [Enhygromyxa salina]|uniref:Lipoprotein n=1 Tax=Enhygromyxa salina TaxID=215803 RepID=A0A2S9XFA9_9BACT|nr:hypothetical protein [Enhygromyxa salina]PRP91558.1 hypothetical protein ENSA5_54130 [Enhygromyxa salina]
MNSARHPIILCLGLALVASCGLDRNAPEDKSDPLDTSFDSGTPDSGDSSGSGNAVEACQTLEDTLADCQPSLAGSLQCSTYDEWPCDLTDYFDCITDAYGSCSGGTFPNIDAAGLQDCTALTTCS